MLGEDEIEKIIKEWVGVMDCSKKDLAKAIAEEFMRGLE